MIYLYLETLLTNQRLENYLHTVYAYVVVIIIHFVWNLISPHWKMILFVWHPIHWRPLLQCYLKNKHFIKYLYGSLCCSFKFEVMPDDYLVHIPHPLSDSHRYATKVFQRFVTCLWTDSSFVDCKKLNIILFCRCTQLRYNEILKKMKRWYL